MDDLEGIRLLKGGDIAGLEILVRRYQIKAARAAFLITRDVPLAEDIVQETFLRLYTRARHFDESRPFEPYLMRAVVNAALNAVKREDKGVQFGDPQEFESSMAKAASAEIESYAESIKSEILTALFKLPARQRAAIVQRYYLQMNEKEMASALGAAPGTIKWLLSSARARLRTLLGAERSSK